MGGTAPWGPPSGFVNSSLATASPLWRLPGWKYPTKERKTPNSRVFPPEPSLQLAGGGCRCTGVLEVQLKGQWSRVCRDGVSEARAKSICQQLDCGPPVPGPPRLTVTGGKELTHAWTPRCSGPADTLARCRWVLANCTEHAVLVCSGENGPPTTPPHPHRPTTPTCPCLFVLEPVKTTPEPPPAPPTTTPEPTGKSPIPAAMAELGGTHKANCPPALPGRLVSLIVFVASIKLWMWQAQELSAR